MKIKKLIPEFLKEYFLLTKQRIKYPDCNIYSHLIGKDCKLGYSVGIRRNVEIHDNCTIDDYSYINANSAVGFAIIGKYCSIGYNCQIGMHKHPTNFVSTSPYTYGKNNIFSSPSDYEDFQEKVVIGNDCWIGSNVVIMQGVTIGDGAIIAASSVVTKDVEPYSIVAGVPAKIIKKRFNESQIDFLMKLKWWDMDKEEINKYKEMFLKKEDWFLYFEDLL